MNRKKKPTEAVADDFSIEIIIAKIIDKNRLLQGAMILHPKALPRASVVGKVAKEVSDYVLQLETLWRENKMT
ncbi:hypothetical protein L0244_32880 [bacterium]|nr:hypothetical protein [bacterium]